ncbi:Uncharacterized protein HZ326_29387 [Fusarium oxysporum f. sp. albedinis]|nr:Uncharacterized protein HZ326_29387 [Fusarium oxysporum f. sp. albedinis]
MCESLSSSATSPFSCHLIHLARAREQDALDSSLKKLGETTGIEEAFRWKFRLGATRSGSRQLSVGVTPSKPSSSSRCGTGRLLPEFCSVS